MTDDELRAAAERVAVVAAEYSAAAKQIKPRTEAEGRLAGQVIALGFIAADMAAKCLDLLPPADDAEAVTVGWLESVGFRHVARDGGSLAIGLPDGRNRVRMRLINSTWAIGVTNIPDMPTRGHVRRLLVAGDHPGESR